MAAAAAAETVRLEEFTGILQNRLVCAWQSGQSPWLPTEFMLSQYITRILVVSRLSPLSTALASDPSWTQVWRSPGAKEWSCLLGMLEHMPGPTLVVVGPDVGLSAKLTAALRESDSVSLTVVLRTVGSHGAGAWVGETPDNVFFPVVDGGGGASAVMRLLEETSLHAYPRHMNLATLLPQLAAQGYALTVANGRWMWYRPGDSLGLTTMTVSQIAKQIQILGSVLERIV